MMGVSVAPMNKDKANDHPHVIALPPLIFLLYAVAGFGMHILHPSPVASPAAGRTVGVLLGILSGFLAIWARSVMKAGGTNIRPDRPAVAVVTDGPFRFTRNPLYLSLCLLLLAGGFFINDWMLLLATVPLAVTLHFGVILREEVYLERKFGASYLDFKRQVRRWI